MLLVLEGVGRGPSSEYRAPASVSDARCCLREKVLKVANAPGGLDPGFALECPEAEFFPDDFFHAITGVVSKVLLNPALGVPFPSVV